MQPYIVSSHPTTERSYRSTICVLPESTIILYPNGTRVVLNDIAARQQRSFMGHKAPVTAVAVHPKGYWVASGDSKGKLKIWAPKHETMMVDNEIEIGPVSSLSFNVDGSKLLIGCRNSKTAVYLYDLSMKTLTSMTAQSSTTCAAFRMVRPFLSVACAEDGSVACYGGLYKFEKSLFLKELIQSCV